MIPMELADRRVLNLQEQMARLPQVALQTRHHFADGMYARELHLPAGTLLVGKMHRRQHFFLITKGRIAVLGEDGATKILEAGAIFSSQPGAKRAGFAVEDTICVTVHRTEHTDVDLIEKEIIEPDDLALFDAHNQLKEPQCPGLP